MIDKFTSYHKNFVNLQFITADEMMTDFATLLKSFRLRQVIPVMGIPRKCGHCLAVIYSNIVALNTGLFTRYVRRHHSKKINTKKLPEKLFRCLRES